MSTIMVTTLDDESFFGFETLANPDGTGLSLREAIGLASDGDTIAFSADLAGDTIDLTNGVILFDRDITLTIEGSITLDALGRFGVVDVDAGDLTLDGLTLTGGSATDGAGAHVSGGSLTSTAAASASARRWPSSTRAPKPGRPRSPSPRGSAPAWRWRTGR